VAFLLPFSRRLSVNLLDILSWRLSANLPDILSGDFRLTYSTFCLVCLLDSLSGVCRWIYSTFVGCFTSFYPYIFYITLLWIR